MFIESLVYELLITRVVKNTSADLKSALLVSFTL